MKFPAWLVMLAMVIGVAVGVVLTPSCFSADSQSPGAKAGKGQTQQGDPVLFRVNGEAVTASELIASPFMRQGLLDYTQHIKLSQIVKAEGIEVDEADIDAELVRQQDYAIASGESWESSLKKKRLTEDEVRESLRWNLVLEEVAETRAEITEEMLDDYWDRNKEIIVRRYLVRNSIPQTEAESAKVTKEIARDMVYDDLYNGLKMTIIMNFRAEVVTTTELDLACINDPDNKALLEDLILNFAKADAADFIEQNQSDAGNTALGGSEGQAVSVQ